MICFYINVVVLNILEHALGGIGRVLETGLVLDMNCNSLFGTPEKFKSQMVCKQTFRQTEKPNLFIVLSAEEGNDL